MNEILDAHFSELYLEWNISRAPCQTDQWYFPGCQQRTQSQKWNLEWECFSWRQLLCFSSLESYAMYTVQCLIKSNFLWTTNSLNQWMFPLFHIRTLSFVFTCYCGAFLFDPVLTAPLLHLTDFGVMLKCGTCTSVHIYLAFDIYGPHHVTNIAQEHIHTQPSRRNNIDTCVFILL